MQSVVVPLSASILNEEERGRDGVSILSVFTQRMAQKIDVAICQQTVPENPERSTERCVLETCLLQNKDASGDDPLWNQEGVGDNVCNAKEDGVTFDSFKSPFASRIIAPPRFV